MLGIYMSNNLEFWVDVNGEDEYRLTMQRVTCLLIIHGYDPSRY